MMKSYGRILQNTNDKKGWEWLKSHFVNSLIWYSKKAKEKAEKAKQRETKKDEDDQDGIVGIDDNSEDDEDQEDNKQKILQQTLLW